MNNQIAFCELAEIDLCTVPFCTTQALPWMSG
jgi:hypothetical protein